VIRRGTGFLASGSAIASTGLAALKWLDESSSIGDELPRSRVRRVGTGDVTARAIRNESGAPSHRHRHVIARRRSEETAAPLSTRTRRVLGAGEQWLSPISLRGRSARRPVAARHAPERSVHLVARRPRRIAHSRAPWRANCIAPRDSVFPSTALRIGARPRPRRRRVLAQSACRAAALTERGFNFENPTIESIVVIVLRLTTWPESPACNVSDDPFVRVPYLWSS